MTSRIDSLEAPQGAARGPLVVVLLVLVLVVGVLVMGVWGWGWLVALLLPVGALSLYMAVAVVRSIMGPGAQK